MLQQLPLAVSRQFLAACSESDSCGSPALMSRASTDSEDAFAPTPLSAVEVLCLHGGRPDNVECALADAVDVAAVPPIVLAAHVAPHCPFAPSDHRRPLRYLRSIVFDTAHGPALREQDCAALRIIMVRSAADLPALGALLREKQLPALERLECPGAALSPDLAAALLTQRSTLRALVFGAAAPATVRRLLADLPRLAELGIATAADGIAAVVAEPRITTVALGASSEEALRPLRFAAHVTSLTLWCGAPAAVLGAVASMPRLQSLVLDPPPGALVEAPGLAVLATCRRLNRLELRGGLTVGDAPHVAALLAAFPPTAPYHLTVSCAREAAPRGGRGFAPVLSDRVVHFRRL